MSSHLRMSAFRLVAVLTVSLALAMILAEPAAADPGEGWSDPEEVSIVRMLLFIVGLPVGLALVITALVYAPSLARGERLSPGAPSIENQWIGGPRRTSAELAAPDSEESNAGGASGRW